VKRSQGGVRTVCLVGTAPPRQCGIATFTEDLRRGLVEAAPGVSAVQVALTDDGCRYDYGPSVVFEVQASQLSDYRTAAEFLDRSEVDLVCVQHEFGIFGGPAGRYVDELLDGVRGPVVTTLHTVLGKPPPRGGWRSAPIAWSCSPTTPSGSSSTPTGYRPSGS
jgi:hypothetical protein